MTHTTYEATTRTSSTGINQTDGWSSGQMYDPIAEHVFYSRLDQIRSMKSDWDSSGAAAPDAAVVDRARRFAQRCISFPMPAANPTYEGGVQLEWHLGDRTLEIEFLPGEDPSFIQWDHATGVAKAEGVLVMPLTATEIIAFEAKVRSLVSWALGE